MGVVKGVAGVAWGLVLFAVSVATLAIFVIGGAALVWNVADNRIGGLIAGGILVAIVTLAVRARRSCP